MNEVKLERTELSTLIFRLVQKQDKIAHTNEMGKDFQRQTSELILERAKIMDEMEKLFAKTAQQQINKTDKKLKKVLNELKKDILYIGKKQPNATVSYRVVLRTLERYQKLLTSGKSISTTTNTCSMCGFDFLIDEEASVGSCPACGAYR